MEPMSVTLPDSLQLRVPCDACAPGTGSRTEAPVSGCWVRIPTVSGNGAPGGGGWVYCPGTPESRPRLSPARGAGREAAGPCPGHEAQRLPESPPRPSCPPHPMPGVEPGPALHGNRITPENTNNVRCQAPGPRLAAPQAEPPGPLRCHESTLPAGGRPALRALGLGWASQGGGRELRS